MHYVYTEHGYYEHRIYSYMIKTQYTYQSACSTPFTHHEQQNMELKPTKIHLHKHILLQINIK